MKHIFIFCSRIQVIKLVAFLYMVHECVVYASLLSSKKKYPVDLTAYEEKLQEKHLRHEVRTKALTMKERLQRDIQQLNAKLVQETEHQEWACEHEKQLNSLTSIADNNDVVQDLDKNWKRKKNRSDHQNLPWPLLQWMHLEKNGSTGWEVTQTYLVQLKKQHIPKQVHISKPWKLKQKWSSHAHADRKEKARQLLMKARHYLMCNSRSARFYGQHDGQHYCPVILKVLKKTYPNLSVSVRAMNVLNDFVCKVGNKLTEEANLLWHKSGRKTLTACDFAFASDLLLPGELWVYAKAKAFSSLSKLT